MSAVFLGLLDLKLFVDPFLDQLRLNNVILIRCKLQLGNVLLTTQYWVKPQYHLSLGTVHRMPKIPILLQTQPEVRRHAQNARKSQSSIRRRLRGCSDPVSCGLLAR